jgi:hypothetical protein
MRDPITRLRLCYAMNHFCACHRFPLNAFVCDRNGRCYGQPNDRIARETAH